MILEQFLSFVLHPYKVPFLDLIEQNICLFGFFFCCSFFDSAWTDSKLKANVVLSESVNVGSCILFGHETQDGERIATRRLLLAEYEEPLCFLQTQSDASVESF